MTYTAKERKALEAGFQALTLSVKQQLGRRAQLLGIPASKVPEVRLAQAAATLKTYFMFRGRDIWRSRGEYGLILKHGDREVSIVVSAVARNVLIDVNRIGMIATKTKFNAKMLIPSDSDINLVQSRIVSQLKELLPSGLLRRDDQLVLRQRQREVYFDFLEMAYCILIAIERAHAAINSPESYNQLLSIADCESA